jgi:hypothetical protein
VHNVIPGPEAAALQKGTQTLDIAIRNAKQSNPTLVDISWMALFRNIGQPMARLRMQKS